MLWLVETYSIRRCWMRYYDVVGVSSSCVDEVVAAVVDLDE